MDHDPALAVLDDEKEEEEDGEDDDEAEAEGEGEEGSPQEGEGEGEEHVLLVPPPLLFNLSGGLRPCRCAFFFGLVGCTLYACTHV